MNTKQMLTAKDVERHADAGGKFIDRNFPAEGPLTCTCIYDDDGAAWMSNYEGYSALVYFKNLEPVPLN